MRNGRHEHVCPDCGSGALHLSNPKGLIEKLLFYVFFIAPLRCEECFERHLSFCFPRPVRTMSRRHGN